MKKNKVAFLFRKIVIYITTPSKGLQIVLSPFRKWLVQLNGVSVGSGTLILGKPLILNFGGDISIGEKTRIVSSQSNHEIGISNKCVFTTRYGGNIAIGDNSNINGATIRSYDAITIGSNVWITAGCYIMDSDGHPVDSDKRASEELQYIKTKPIVIADNVWIGIQTIILPGVTIGKNSVIGAGSVVTKDVPPDTLAAGNPASVIKSL